MTAMRPKWQPRTSRSIISSREYATVPRQKLDVQRLRLDVDERARLGFYTLVKTQGALKIERDVANAVIKEFTARQTTIDHSSNIKSLASSALYLLVCHTPTS
jgi:hypothetical protein